MEKNVRRGIQYLIIIVLVGLVVFRIYQRVHSRPAEVAEAKLLVSVQPVETANLKEIFSFSGTIEPDQAVPILSRISGRLEAVYHQEGDFVSKGTLLAQVEERDYRLRLEEAKAALRSVQAELENAESFYRRMAKLYEEEVITIQELENATSRRDAAQATVERLTSQVSLAEEQLADCRITAPFSGYVGKRYLDPGIFLTPSSGPILELVSLSRVKIKVPVGETELARIKVGQPVTIKPDAYPEISFTGRLARISPLLDPVTRTTMGEITIANPSGQLKSGMFVRAEILVAMRNGVVVVPEEALLRQAEEVIIYVVKDGIAHRRLVQTGVQEGSLVEITEGVSSGELIVTAGQNSLYDGAAVEISAAEKSGFDTPLEPVENNATKDRSNQ